MRVAAIGRRAELDSVAGEQYLLPRQPHDRVAGRVRAADMDHLRLTFAKPERHSAVERVRRPGQAGDAFAAAEQARKTADLAVHVLLPALDDQVARDVGGR